MHPAGGAFSDSRERRLMNAAARYAGSAGERRKMSSSSKKPLRLLTWKALGSRSWGPEDLGYTVQGLRCRV
jgi:hypothetical protein